MTAQIFTRYQSAQKIIHQMPLKRNEMALWRNETGFRNFYFGRDWAEMGMRFIN
jgi:hypothetical protein